MTPTKSTKVLLFVGALCGLLVGCSKHGTTEQSSAAAASPAAAAQSSPATNASTEVAPMPPVYPNARVDTSQGDKGVLSAPTLQMVTRYYKTSDSWDAVSRWYLAHTKGWKGYSKPGGGDLTLSRAEPLPATIMISGNNTGAEIIVELFRTKQQP